MEVLLANGGVGKRSSVVVAVIAALTACGGSVARPNQPRTEAGMTRRAFADSQRMNWTGTGPRPVTTLVWYPTASPPAETLSIGPPGGPLFLAGVVSGNAPIAGGDRRPLVLLSHGTGGSALQMAWLGIALAREGFIAAAVNHHGNTGAEPPLDPRGFMLWWERAIDIGVAIDRILADSILGPRVDRDRIGVAGFSLGGYTALAMVGALTDREAFEAFCRSPARDFTCEPQPEFPEARAAFARLIATDSAVRASLARAGVSHRDPRIRAAVALAPAVVQALRPASIAAIPVPLLVIVGDSDRVAPAATNARAIVAHRPGTELVEIPGGGHYVFLNPCTARGADILRDVCVDGAGVDRAAVQRTTAERIATFLRHAW